MKIAIAKNLRVFVPSWQKKKRRRRKIKKLCAFIPVKGAKRRH